MQAYELQHHVLPLYAKLVHMGIWQMAWQMTGLLMRLS